MRSNPFPSRGLALASWVDSSQMREKIFTVLGNFLALFVGIPAYLIWLFIIFFPGAGPFGKNSFVEMFALFAPVIGLFAFVRSPIGIAFLPLLGIVNALVFAILTQGMSTNVAVFCNFITSVLWIAVPYISLLRKRKS